MSQALSRNQIAWRIAQDLEDGAHVNLGIGMPELIANYIPGDRDILLHSENGLLGMGPEPEPGDGDPDLINAGKKTVTVIPGGSFFHHTDAFAMIRGGHIDVCVLGAYQISEAGDLANWATPDNSRLPGVGGAMDLAAGAKKIFVMTGHCTRDGAPKLLGECAYPLTASGVVDRVYSDLAVIDVTEDGFLVREIVAGLSEDELQSKTGTTLRFADDCKELTTPEI